MAKGKSCIQELVDENETLKAKIKELEYELWLNKIIKNK